MGGAEYVVLKEDVTPPVIQGIVLSQTHLSEGNACSVSIDAVDVDGGPLEYITEPGLFRSRDGTGNTFKVKATRARIPEPFVGAHTYQIYAINQGMSYRFLPGSSSVSPIDPVLISEGQAAEEAGRVIRLGARYRALLDSATTTGYSLPSRQGGNLADCMRESATLPVEGARMVGHAC